MLGHRLHSLILATVGGTPVVGIASSVGPKTVGVLSLLGLSDFVVPIGTIAGGDVTERAKAALEGQPGVRQRVDKLHATSDADFDAFVERVGAPDIGLSDGRCEGSRPARVLVVTGIYPPDIGGRRPTPPISSTSCRAVGTA